MYTTFWFWEFFAPHQFHFLLSIGCSPLQLTFLDRLTVWLLAVSTPISHFAATSRTLKASKPPIIFQCFFASSSSSWFVLPAILVFSVMVLWICGRLQGFVLLRGTKARNTAKKRGLRWINSAEKLEVEKFRVNSSLK